MSPFNEINLLLVILKEVNLNEVNFITSALFFFLTEPHFPTALFLGFEMYCTDVTIQFTNKNWFHITSEKD